MSVNTMRNQIAMKLSSWCR